MTHPTSFVDEIQRHTGETDWLESEHIATQVLHALRPMLRSDERKALAAHLPPSLGSALAGHAVEVDDDLDRFYARVALSLKSPLPRAMEEARIVCALLASRLTPDERARLASDLPPGVAVLFTTPAGGSIETLGADPSGENVPPARSERAVDSTLATGRPGSAHPISESRLDRTQSHSVAREANPHSDSKLSSAEGLTQEQLHESLATGATRHR
jgi:uncharacterized protein (DUF2267 family)